MNIIKHKNNKEVCFGIYEVSDGGPDHFRVNGHWIIINTKNPAFHFPLVREVIKIKKSDKNNWVSFKSTEEAHAAAWLQPKVAP